MARASYTPVTYWMTMPLKKLYGWIDTVNEVESEERAERENGRR